MNKKIITASALFLGLFVVVAIVYLLTANIGKNQVAIYTLPADATVTIDGKAVSGETQYLAAGEYAIKVERQDFRSQTIVKQVVDGNNTAVTIGLEPANDAGQKWLDDNAEAVAEFESKVGAVANAEGEAFQKKNPIVKDLPYQNYLFTIGYRSDPGDPSGQSIILVIDAPEIYRQQALTQIYNLGYDPTDYKINFSNFRSDF